jgi:hypothetical protein
MAVLDFIWRLILGTLIQMVSVLGGVAAFGLLINMFSQASFTRIAASFGVRATYLVSWLGTPVHEIGHALFCLIFMHKIVSINLFNPDPHSDKLGWVAHTWNHKNPWAVLGNVFVGIGPMILGCAVLFGLVYFIVPNGRDVWSTIFSGVTQVNAGMSFLSYVSIIGNSLLNTLGTIFNPANLGTWQFWLFVYLSYCVATNIRLSPADLKIAVLGLGWVVLPFALLTLWNMTVGSESTASLQFSASFIGVTYGLLALALILVLLGWLFTLIISGAFDKLRGR